MLVKGSQAELILAFGWPLNSTAGELLRRRIRRPQSRWPWEDGGRDQSDEATSQGVPGATRSWRTHGGFPH